MTVAPGEAIEAADVIKSGYVYAADAGSSDAYAVSLPTSPGAYADGLVIRFKANTANTGAATLAVNGLAAITIVRADGSTLQTGDIIAGQAVEVVYRNSAFYMVSNPSAPLGENYLLGLMHAAYAKTFHVIQALFIVATGDSDGATTTNFPHWVPSDTTDVKILPFGAGAAIVSAGAATLLMDEFPFWKTGQTGLSYFTSASDPNILIAQWGMKYVSGIGEAMMGFGDQMSGLYGDNANRACFHIANGVLYALTSKADPNGQEVRTDISSGLTITNWNDYRIEFDLGAGIVRFYVNGSLKHTATSAYGAGDSVPAAGTVNFGFGRHATNPVLFNLLPPYIAVELNP